MSESTLRFSASDLPLTPAGVRPVTRAVTWRSLLIGTLSVIAICALVPYNDFVLSDTSLSAGYLPLAAILILFVLAIANAPLRRFAPQLALNGRELAVVTLMTLIGCALPNWGLARFWVPMPVAPFHIGSEDPQFWKAFQAMGLPHWLYPVHDMADARSDPIVQWFFCGVPQGEHIPWSAWIRPLLAWGVFIAAMLAMLVAMGRLVVDQWVDNERLPFPLVQVQMALVEEPAPGRSLNAMLSNRAMWIGLLSIFAIHSLTGLKAYFPRYVPSVPLGYNFAAIFAEAPWSYLDTKVKQASISFMIVGAAFFIRSRVSFSLWATYLLVVLARVIQQVLYGEAPDTGSADQHLGASVVFIAGIIWLSRRYWAQVIQNAFGRSDDSRYRFSFWTVVVSAAVMIGWLTVVGVHWWMAAGVVLFIAMAHLVVSRVLAETGLPFFRSGIAVSQVYNNLPVRWFGGKDILFAGVFSILGPLTTRDGVMCQSMHGLAVTKQAGVEPGEHGRLGAAVAWALLLGTIVAASSTLYCQYSYDTPTSVTPASAGSASPQRNYFGAYYVPRRDMANAVKAFDAGRFPPQPTSTVLHVGIGMTITALLQFASLRWAAWPFLPVGYVATYGAFLANAWFSVFFGWLAKVLIVRFGGGRLFERAKPFFLGLIIGEALAAAFWLIINAIVVLNGGPTVGLKILL